MPVLSVPDRVPLQQPRGWPDRWSLRVDRPLPNRKRNAQTTDVHQGEAAAADRFRYATQELTDLLVGKGIRQPFQLRKPNLFL